MKRRDGDGIEGTIRRGMRRGTLTIDRRLDLHGFTQSAAHSALARFLSRAASDGVRLVLVITGKGGSGAETLNRLVPLWLREGDLRARVSMVRPAAAEHGGAGAYYVYLARSTRARSAD